MTPKCMDFEYQEDQQKERELDEAQNEGRAEGRGEMLKEVLEYIEELRSKNVSRTEWVEWIRERFKEDLVLNDVSSRP